MATYKCEIQQRFGKYDANVWVATSRPGPSKIEGVVDLQTAIKGVQTALEGAGFKENDDNVIFRDRAFATWAELRDALRGGKY